MKSLPKGPSGNTLPMFAEITIEQFRDLYPKWLRWRALDKPLLTDLRAQPEDELDGLLYIDNLYEMILAQYYERQRKESEGK